MKIMSAMLDLEGGTASLGLYGDLTEDSVRPPHVQVTVSMDMVGTADTLRRDAIKKALTALDAARAALEAEL